jgi:hypothetical protein
MKKNELRRLLKPLVKQCIKEVLLEEGVLSNIVSEVVSGLSSGVVLESKTEQTYREPPVEQLYEQQEVAQKQKIQESRKQMLAAIGRSSYNDVDLFENTTPLAKGGESTSDTPTNSPLSGLDPSDPGIDISGLMNKTGVWKSLVGGDK